MDYGIILNNLVIIFVMIGVGFFAGRAHLVSDRASGDFTAFLMNIAVPCMIFNSMVREFDPALMVDSAILFVMGLVFLAGTMAVNGLVAKLFHISNSRHGVWVLAASASNGGFMGIPMILAIFGGTGVFLAGFLNLGYTIILYTVGVHLVCRSAVYKDGNSAGQAEEPQAKVNWRKVFLNNNNYAIALGLLFFVGQIPVPDMARTVLQYFGNITTPLSMFLIGLSLSNGKISDIFKDKDVIRCSVMRLLGIPLLVAAILYFLPLPDKELMVGVTLLTTAMPSASLAMMFAEQYGGDTVMASRAIFMTSVCCMVTIPLIMLLV